MLESGSHTVLRETDGGVREVVVGDIMRRLVARTMAKQIAKKVEKSHSSFPARLDCKSRICECVAHILETIMAVDGCATVVSIDEVGAYDLISRNALSDGLLGMGQGDQTLFSRGVSLEARRRT